MRDLTDGAKDESCGGSELNAELDTDWKEVAIQLGQRINYLISNCSPKFGQMINIETREIIDGVDYIADGLEMLPGVKVNREYMRMTKAQRKKSRTVPNRIL